jgi:uncharacterized peroxidase-related enzyme
MDSGEANALLTALEGDLRTASLPPSDLAMLDYVAKLTRAPQALAAADIASLRSAGFDDRAIHDICAITGYFAFVNRIADGLGVELEGRFSP